jgi:hypothetical protein
MYILRYILGRFFTNYSSCHPVQEFLCPHINLDPSKKKNFQNHKFPAQANCGSDSKKTQIGEITLTDEEGCRMATANPSPPRYGQTPIIFEIFCLISFHFNDKSVENYKRNFIYVQFIYT